MIPRPISASFAADNSKRRGHRVNGPPAGTEPPLQGRGGRRDLGLLLLEAEKRPGAVQRTPGYGDVWTFTAICADTKLIPTWLVGERTKDDAEVFLTDLASRMANRIQLSTDGHRIYESTVGRSFNHEVDWAQIQKKYASAGEPGKYSPAICTGIRTRVLKGNPDEARISTSYVERQNLTMRMGMRRFTRLTNGFSRKVENLSHAVSLHFMFYNFARPHKTVGMTPAMAAGVADHKWSLKEIAALLD